MQLHLIYFILLFLFMLPNFFVMAYEGIEWDLVFTAIHPFVIIIVTARAIGSKANTLER